MLDASRYAEHFPDEKQTFEIQDIRSVSILRAMTPTPLLLAALSRLEREFSDILRAQNPAQTGGSD
jgi:hypothetical protein